MKNYPKLLVFLFSANLSLMLLLAKPGMSPAADSNKCPLPRVDILGEDIPGFPRYPNSIRVRFTRETEKNVITISKRAKGTEVSYRSNDSMDKILDFYSRQLTDKGWKLHSSNYMGETSIHMVFSQGEDNILFTLRPHRTGIGLRRKDSAKEEPPTPIDCFVIQVFLWNEKDARPLERMSPPLRDKNQSSRRLGR